MDISEALHLLVDVATGAKAVLTSPEGEAIKDALDQHFHPAAAPPAEPAGEPAAEPPPAAPFGSESQPEPASSPPPESYPYQPDGGV